MRMNNELSPGHFPEKGKSYSSMFCRLSRGRINLRLLLNTGFQLLPPSLGRYMVF
jgi:hypothetical protein